MFKHTFSSRFAFALPLLFAGYAQAEIVSFSGSVKNGEAFAKDVAADKQFVMKPNENGWTFSVVTKPTGDDLTAGFNLPIRFNGTQFLDGSYGEDGADGNGMRLGNQRSICFLADLAQLKKARENTDILYWPKGETEQKNAIRELVNLHFGYATVDITDRKMEAIPDCKEGNCMKTISVTFKVSVNTTPKELPKNVDCISNL